MAPCWNKTLVSWGKWCQLGKGRLMDNQSTIPINLRGGIKLTASCWAGQSSKAFQRFDLEVLMIRSHFVTVRSVTDCRFLKHFGDSHLHHTLWISCRNSSATYSDFDSSDLTGMTWSGALPSSHPLRLWWENESNRRINLL